MRAVLLCAGYGTRFVRDVEASEAHRHLLAIPKPLLPIGGRPLIDHWIEAIERTEAIQRLVIVANDGNFPAFSRNPGNAASSKPVVVINDGSQDNESRSGSVACMALGLESNLDGHALFIAGDTLFDSRFDLDSVLAVFQQLNADPGTAASSLILDCPCPEDEVHKHGIIETDARGRVVSFLEKPNPEATASRKQCPCFYIIHRAHLGMIGEFLEATLGQPLKARDATGHFLKFLVEKQPVVSLSVAKRYDVGGLDSYLKCCNDFQ